MKDCIFCQIVKGRIPCYKVYEDKKFLGFLDVAPLNLGHCLVIPKKHFRWVDDVPDFGAYFEVAKKAGLAVKEILSPDFVSYFTIGTDVFHAHIHVLPRFANDGHKGMVDLKNVKKIPEKKMREIAESIRNRVKI